MNEPQHLGLGELGQRVQALSDPAPDLHLRPYQGEPAATGSASNGRPGSAYGSAPSLEPYADHQTSSIQPPFPEPYQPAPVASGVAQSKTLDQSAAWEATPSRPAATTSYRSESVSPMSSQAVASSTQPSPSSGSSAPKSGLHRAFDAIRSTLPLVQKILPIIDGNFATAVSSLMAPPPQHYPPPPLPQVQIDLEPIERGLAEIHTSHRELRGQVMEHVSSLKRVEDQLERVREATDRNTLEQQELVEDLRNVGGRISTFAILGAVLLAVSLGLNIYLIIQLQHILR